MKTKILSLMTVAGMALLFQGCHDPEVVPSNGDAKGILALTAKIVGDDSSDNNFSGVIDYDAQTILVRFTQTYPVATDNPLDPDLIKNVRLTAALATNATIEPALTTMDLSKTNYITVTNAQGVRKRYSVHGEILPYWESSVVDMTLDSGVSCIVDNEQHVITLLTAEDDLEPQTATFEVSPHATIVPDITTTPFDFDAEDATITVIAENGVDKTEYTFAKGEPNRVQFGFREGSQQLLWVKKWNEAGYTLRDKQTGFGVTNDYLILNEVGNMQAVVLDAKKGTDTGLRLDMGIIPTGMNYNMTSDNAGNIIVNSKYGDKESLFKIWVFKGLDDPGTLLLDQSVYGAGDRVSVYGDITKDAVITTTLSGTSLQACRWFVKDGVLGKSEVITLGGIGSTPWGNADLACTSATSNTADIYGAIYATVNGKRGPALFDGTTFAAKAVGLPNTKKRDTEADGGQSDAGNWIMNACDYVEFNKNKYLFHNSVNTFTWGENDMLFLIDVSGGDLTNECIDFNRAPVRINHQYGAMMAQGVGVGANGNDARLWVDENGFFMYGYFLYTNGYIGCFRVDCIDK
ncbi:MAG: DUF5018 domain-containing protein [Muribaculaceae bacterium]|nr:DUF5018 domain-containing protein [Bacteroides sp.]MDE7472146.1 DUF5018 domain-containing protein [Muribaculaceae bacterium]